MKTIGPIIFGEVLFDCFPDGSAVLGGAPFNVYAHLGRMGLDPLMITRVGEDERGNRLLAAMGERNLRTDCLLYTSPSPRDLSTSRMPSSA